MYLEDFVKIQKKLLQKLYVQHKKITVSTIMKTGNFRQPLDFFAVVFKDMFKQNS